jgi:uncharacterized delta-60 repeat protein
MSRHDKTKRFPGHTVRNRRGASFRPSADDLERRELLAGLPDTSFGPSGSGAVVLDALPGAGEYDVAAPLPDGRTLVAATATGGGVTLLRLNGDGSTDTAFGTGGRAPGVAGLSTALQVVSLPDGRFLVAGTTPSVYYDPSTHFALARYLADGTPDTTFGTVGTGLATAAIGKQDLLSRVAIADDGSVVAVGSTGANFFGADDTFDIALARFTPDGRLDASFGKAGVVATDVSGRRDLGVAVALAADGRILVGGLAAPRDQGADFLVARYLPDGRLDDAFGAGGLFTRNASSTGDDLDSVQALAPLADGRVVAAGSAGGNPSLALFRLTADGRLDTTFGGGLVVRPRDPARVESPGAGLALLPGGAVVVAGLSSDPNAGDPRAVLWRYRADGTADPAFGEAGALASPIVGGRYFDVATLADGTLLASGGVTPAVGDTSGLLARYVVNLAPTPLADTFPSGPVAFAVPAPGVLGNDTDPDGDPLSAVLVTPPSAGSLTLNADGSFAYQPGDFIGTTSFTYRVTDGRLSSAPVTVTIIITPPRVVPPPPAPALAAASDTGASASDNVTAATTLTFDAAGIAAGNRARLLRDGRPVAERDGPGPVNDPGPVPDGTHRYQIVQVEPDGVASAPGAETTVVVDTAAPAPPSAPALLAADDTGVVGDRNTRDSRPRLVGSAEPGSSVELLDANGSVLTIALADPGGIYTLQPPSALADGVYSFRVLARDRAGNASAPGGVLELSVDGRPPLTVSPVLVVVTPGALPDTSGSDAKALAVALGVAPADGAPRPVVPSWVARAAQAVYSAIAQAVHDPTAPVKVLVLDWDTRGNALDPARQSAARVLQVVGDTSLDARPWDVLLIGQGRGAVLNQDLAAFLAGSPRVDHVEAVLLQPFANLLAEDAYPATAPSGVAAETVYDSGHTFAEEVRPLRDPSSPSYALNTLEQGLPVQGASVGDAREAIDARLRAAGLDPSASSSAPAAYGTVADWYVDAGPLARDVARFAAAKDPAGSPSFVDHDPAGRPYTPAIQPVETLHLDSANAPGAKLLAGVSKAQSDLDARTAALNADTASKLAAIQAAYAPQLKDAADRHDAALAAAASTLRSENAATDSATAFALSQPTSQRDRAIASASSARDAQMRQVQARENNASARAQSAARAQQSRDQKAEYARYSSQFKSLSGSRSSLVGTANRLIDQVGGLIDQYNRIVDRLDDAFGGLVRRLTSQLGDLGRQIDRINGQINRAKDQIRQLDQRLRDLGTQYTRKVAAIADRAARAIRSAADTAARNIQAAGRTISRNYQDAVQAANVAFERTKNVILGRDAGFKKAAQEKYDSAKKTADAAYTSTVTAVNSGIDDASRTVTKAAADTADTVKKAAVDAAKAVVDAVQQLLHGVVAYDITSKGSLTFNFETGTYSADIDAGFGVSLDTANLKDLAAGKLTVPRFNPLEVAVSSSGLTLDVTDNYDQVRASYQARYPGGDVYVSSRRFTEWADSQTAARLFALTALGAGGSAASEVVDQLTLELSDITAWLKARGVKEFQRQAARVLSAILTRTDLDDPSLEVAVKFDTVNYHYMARLAGFTKLASDVLSGVVPAFKMTIDSAKVGLDDPHLAFAIIWKGGATADPLAAALSRFDPSRPADPSAFQGDLASILSAAAADLDPKVKAFLRGIDVTASLQREAEAKLRTLLQSKLGLSASDVLSAYVAGNPVVDLRNTPAARLVPSLLSALPQGNSGAIEVNRLEFNLETYGLSAEFTVRHRHVF